MVHIDTSKLKHNPEAIKSCFRISKNMTFVTKNIRIVFLEVYLRKELASIDDYVTLVGIYGILDDEGNYATCIAPIQQKIITNKIDDATCTDGKLYKVLYINKDSVMIDNNDLVINDNQLFYICDVFYLRGNIPFYINYKSVSKLLMESQKYNDSRVGRDRIVFEIISSVIARGKDKSVYYRNSEEFLTVIPNWININNLYYSLHSTSSKLVGGYYGAAVGVAVMKPEKTVSTLESLLMGQKV